MSNPRRTFLKVIDGSVGAVAAVFAGGLTWLTVKSKELPLNYDLPDVEPVPREQVAVVDDLDLGGSGALSRIHVSQLR